MKYFLLTGTALLLFGSGAAQAQFYPAPYPVPPIKRHGFAPYLHPKPPVVFAVQVVRPVPVYAPPVHHHAKYHGYPAAPVPQFVPPYQGHHGVPQIGHQQAEQLVTGWYNQYLHRQPDLAGLQNHIHVVATQGEDVALSGILGSDEYWQVCGGDVRSWIASLYIGVMNRQPREDEIQHWHQVLANFGGDRQRVVLNFLPSARLEMRR